MPRSLDLIQFQPYVFGFTPETCANNDNSAYCNLVEDGDSIVFQVKRILGYDFDCSILDVSATQLLANSGFTGSAASWTLVGGWAYGTNDVAITAANGSVSQNFAAMVDNAIYKLVITTTNTLAGGDITALISGGNVGTIPNGSPAGTYSFYGVGDPGASTQCGLQGIGITSTVTSIEMYRAAECFTFDVVSGSLTYDEVNGLSINGNVNIYATLDMEPSATYSPKTNIHFSGVETGTMEISYDTDFSGVMEVSNGDFEWVSNGTQLTTVAIQLIDFIGNIDTITFNQYSTDYYVAVYDLDGNFVQGVSSYISYCRDYLTFNMDPQDAGLSYGCYTFGIFDPLQHNDSFEREYDFTTLGAPWTETGATWTLSANGYEFDAGSNTNATARTTETSSGTFTIAWIKMMVSLGTNTGTGVGTTTVGSQLVDVGTVSALGTIDEVSAGSPRTYTLYDAGDASTIYGTSLQPYIKITSAISGDHYEFTYAFYKIYPYYLDYTSNCFNYKENHDCTKMIYALPGNNLSFNSNECGFIILQRYRIIKITPMYKVVSSDFISSDGTRVLVSGTKQKIWTLLFDRMDELGHDTVSSILLCKEVYIHDTYTNITIDGKRYFILPQDYTPEYDGKNGEYNLAKGRIELLEYDQVKFTTNCE